MRSGRTHISFPICVYVVIFYFVLSSPLSCKENRDPKIVYCYKKRSVQRFKLNAFRALGEESMVYLHCDVVACHKDDSKSRCEKGCVHNSGNVHESKNLSHPQIHTVTVGPVKINMTRVKQAARGEFLVLNNTTIQH